MFGRRGTLPAQSCSTLSQALTIIPPAPSLPYRGRQVDRTQRFGPNRARDVAAFWKGDGAPPPAWDLGIGLIHYSALMEGLAPGNPEAGWVGSWGCWSGG